MLSYLTQTGLVDPAAFAHGGVEVAELSRSHEVWAVRLGGRRLIVKRARPRPGEGAGWLGAEPAIYRAATSVPELRAVTPACLWFDPWRSIIVLEAVEPGVGLREDQAAAGSVQTARLVGTSVGHWHRATRHRSLPDVPQTEPWILRLLVPGGWRPANADRVLALGQIRRELAGHFADLATALDPSCLTHGDLKWDNCLLGGDGVKVIDWETAGVGDPAWDVAGILAEYALLQSVWPVAGQSPGSVPAAVDAFLAGYLAAAAPPDPAAVLTRAARLCGARLVQTALELDAVAPGDGTSQILIDLALANLRDPGPPVGRFVA
jgi:tRNA A-37 threonylcarbamoyl transferase component Bud32